VAINNFYKLFAFWNITFTGLKDVSELEEWKGVLQCGVYTLSKCFLCYFTYFTGLDVHLVLIQIFNWEN
jgi:hypothetical protein